MATTVYRCNRPEKRLGDTFFISECRQPFRPLSMMVYSLPSVHADNEWSPLRSVIVGRAGIACFPSAPDRMIEATIPSEHASKFKPKTMFPPDLIFKAEAELDMFTSILQENGIKVYRPPKDIDWLAEDGYTGAMPRDGLMSVGNTLIEACFAWPSRSNEIEIGFTPILQQLALDPRVNLADLAGSLISYEAML
jgi:glycine amidinotransferase